MSSMDTDHSVLKSHIFLSPSEDHYVSLTMYRVCIVCVPGSIYAMTKAAMGQLSKNLACEWAKDGIRVNNVAPW